MFTPHWYKIKRSNLSDNRWRIISLTLTFIGRCGSNQTNPEWSCPDLGLGLVFAHWGIHLGLNWKCWQGARGLTLGAGFCLCPSCEALSQNMPLPAVSLSARLLSLCPYLPPPTFFFFSLFFFLICSEFCPPTSVLSFLFLLAVGCQNCFIWKDLQECISKLLVNFPWSKGLY